MKSRWFKLKDISIKLRIQGKSIRSIEKKLGIPRSTLSGWLKDIILTEDQKKILKEKSILALFNSRKKASKWHNEQKRIRFKKSK